MNQVGELISSATKHQIPFNDCELNRLFVCFSKNKTVEYQITDTFSVPFVGTVVSGVVMNGIVHAGDQLYLGPDGNGAFQMVTVKSIQRKRLNVPLACAGQSASFGLKKIRRSTIRKGMVMLDKETTPVPRGCREFEAEILVLYHSTTIGHKYQAMLHCGAVRQTARVLAMDKPDQILRTGDRATVRFQFLQPAYLKVGARLIFREGRTKGIGKVSKIVA